MEQIEVNKSEHKMFIVSGVSGRVLNNVIYTTIWVLSVNVNVYIIVIDVVITVNYCKCIWLYSPLNSYLYVQWILDFK